MACICRDRFDYTKGFLAEQLYANILRGDNLQDLDNKQVIQQCEIYGFLKATKEWWK